MKSEKSKDEYGAKVWYEFDPPLTWQKPHPSSPDKYTLQMSLVGIKEQNGPWYLIDHAILGKNGGLQNIGRSEWADWSRDGDLLFSQSGCLYRLPLKNGVLGAIEESKRLADFSRLVFEPKEPTRDALKWPSK